MADPPTADELLVRLLTTAEVVEEHLTVGLDHMLAHSGFTPDMRAAVAEFVTPALGLLREADQQMRRHVQDRSPAPSAAEEGKDRPRGR